MCCVRGTGKEDGGAADLGRQGCPESGGCGEVGGVSLKVLPEELGKQPRLLGREDTIP